jgi:D-aminoacyl-tRNA deacylase
MIALIQRVSEASVHVHGEEVGRIDAGLLALAAVERGDTERTAIRLAERILGYRLFEDSQGRMNLSLADTGGGLLLVSQFTLAADTRKGARPSFTPAAEPARGAALFEALAAAARARHPRVETGRFGARMRVALINEGPVTFWLRVKPEGGEAGIHSV